MLNALTLTDPEVAAAIEQEGYRQWSGIELIASENYCSEAVLAATGSILTNKYAEGYPGRRYYGGCQYVDIVENLARERAKALFGAEHANVQPHSGAQANEAAYMAVLEHGDVVMGMNLAHGGHLTHGSPVNYSGKRYRFVSYGVSRETETIDYDEVERLAREHRPKLIVAGATAYPRFIDFARFREIADRVGALLLVDMAHPAGLIAAGIHPSPVPYAHIVTSTTHKTLRGPRSGFILCKAEFAQAIDRAVFPGLQGGPLMHVIAAKAVCFKEAMTDAFRRDQFQTIANAQTLADELQRHGFRIVSGGTDNHLMLVDLRPFNPDLTGADAEKLLQRAHIIVNKNAIPFDERPPMKASGIRLGTPACTTRGMREDEMRQIGRWIAQVLRDPSDETIERVRGEVMELCQQFPVYTDLWEAMKTVKVEVPVASE